MREFGFFVGCCYCVLVETTQMLSATSIHHVTTKEKPVAKALYVSLTIIAGTLSSITTYAVPKPDDYVFISFDLVLNEADSFYLRDIADDGTIVGDYADNALNQHAFVYSSGKLTPIPPPDDASNELGNFIGMWVRRINNNGQIVGGYNASDESFKGFIYAVETGHYETFAYQESYTEFFGVNNLGVVVGQTYDNGFLYANKTASILPFLADDINDAGQVIGTMRDSNGKDMGAIYTNGAVEQFDPDPLGLTHSVSTTRINSAGAVIGHYTDVLRSGPGSSHYVGYVHSNGKSAIFEGPEAAVTYPEDINDKGLVVGWSRTVGSSFQERNDHCVVWQNGEVGVFDVPGSTSTVCYAVNNVGQIIGEYYDLHRKGHFFIANPASKPIANIKANNSDGPLALASEDTLSITIELFSAEHENADWWVVAKTDSGDWYYYVYPNQWILAGSALTQISPAYQGPLFNLGQFELLRTAHLGAGKYRLYFGVDLSMNGYLDIDQLSYDSVEVHVQ